MICFCYLLFEVYVMKQKIKTIGMISPSIMLSEAGLQEDKWLPYLESLGLKVLMAPSALKGKRQYPVSARETAYDIMEMYRNPEVDALICVHGGAGALRVLEYLDYDVITKNPKPIIGFSDNTSLQLAVYAKTKNPFVTGFSPAYEFREGGISPLVDEEFRKVLAGKKVVAKSGETVSAGVAEGVLLGECLSTISDLSGTPYYPNLSGAILLIEDECEVSYKLGLMLTQLRLNPSFKKVKGIVFGRFSDCQDHPTQGSLEEVLADFCAQVNVPMIKNFNFGHFHERYVLPMGVKYRLDAGKCELCQLKDL